MELKNVDIDIIAVIETWETTLSAQNLAMSNYRKVSKLRTDDKRGG